VPASVRARSTMCWGSFKSLYHAPAAKALSRLKTGRCRTVNVWANSERGHEFRQPPRAQASLWLRSISPLIDARPVVTSWRDASRLPSLTCTCGLSTLKSQAPLDLAVKCWIYLPTAADQTSPLATPNLREVPGWLPKAPTRRAQLG